MNADPQLPIPPHYQSEKVSQVWRVPYLERAQQALEWAREHEIPPASLDNVTVCLLLVDCQNTFCIPEFELFVSGRSGNGAVEDNIRLCEFVYRHLGVLSEIHPTLDTHTGSQIFHPLFWVNEAGHHPEPMTIISADDVKNRAWRVNPDIARSLGHTDYEYLHEHAQHYVERLKQQGKYDLIIWPYHAMVGGIGHALVSAVEEALFFHAVARRSQTGFEIKGDHPLTEHYSVLRPEVLQGPDGNPIASKNTRFLQRLLTFDKIVVAGQAKSHCVAWTVEDLLTEITLHDAEIATNVYLLEDCTSPVVVPGVVDFTDQADAAFRRFADAGMHLVKSTDPMAEWPGMELR